MKVLSLLGSHRLAVVLMGLVGTVVLLGGTLPQAGRLSPEERVRWETDWSVLSTWLDSLRLSDVFGSDWFIALVALLTLNLTAGVALTVRVRWRIWWGRVAAGAAPLSAPQLCLLGVPLLHLGLLLVVAGGGLSALGGFDAHLELTEGEVYSGEPGKLAVARGTAPRVFPATLRLDRAQVEIEAGKYLAKLGAAVTYRQGSGPMEHGEVRTNVPLQLAEYRLFPDNTFGYSAILERRVEDGSRRLMLINFPVPRAEWGQAWKVARNKRVDLPDAPPLFLRMQLSGPERPLFALKVEGGAAAEGVLRPGEHLEVAGFSLLFRGVAPWFGFYLAYDPGRPIVFTGALLALGGFLIHLIAPSRTRVQRGRDGAGLPERHRGEAGPPTRQSPDGAV